MKRVILTVGPQGAGKSTYCSRVLAAHSDILLVSRDDICIQYYGSPFINPYTGGHHHVRALMWERAKELLERDSVTLLLDAFTISSAERSEMVQTLVLYGADKVEALQFMTPPAVCSKWYFNRHVTEADRQRKNFETWRARELDSYAKIFQKYYERNTSMGQGFYRVYGINPMQGELFADVFWWL